MTIAATVPDAITPPYSVLWAATIKVSPSALITSPVRFQAGRLPPSSLSRSLRAAAPALEGPAARLRRPVAPTKLSAPVAWGVAWTSPPLPTNNTKNASMIRGGDDQHKPAHLEEGRRGMKSSRPPAMSAAVPRCQDAGGLWILISAR